MGRPRILPVWAAGKGGGRPSIGARAPANSRLVGAEERRKRVWRARRMTRPAGLNRRKRSRLGRAGGSRSRNGAGRCRRRTANLASSACGSPGNDRAPATPVLSLSQSGRPTRTADPFRYPLPCTGEEHCPNDWLYPPRPSRRPRLAGPPQERGLLMPDRGVPLLRLSNRSSRGALLETSGEARRFSGERQWAAILGRIKHP